MGGQGELAACVSATPSHPWNNECESFYSIWKRGYCKVKKENTTQLQSVCLQSKTEDQRRRHVALLQNKKRRMNTRGQVVWMTDISGSHSGAAASSAHSDVGAKGPRSRSRLKYWAGNPQDWSFPLSNCTALKTNKQNKTKQKNQCLHAAGKVSGAGSKQMVSSGEHWLSLPVLRNTEVFFFGCFFLFCFDHPPLSSGPLKWLHGTSVALRAPQSREQNGPLCHSDNGL